MTRSRYILRGARMAALLCAALLCALSCVPGRALAQESAAIVTAHVRMFQEYRVPASGYESTFDYEIVPLETGAPLPVDESGKSFNTFTLTRDQEMNVEFPVEVKVSESASSYVYHYTLRPVQQQLSDGLYYVDLLSTNLAAGVNVYYLELHVQLASTEAAAASVIPTVHVKGWDGPKVTDPGWRIDYRSQGNKDGAVPSGSSTRQDAGAVSTNVINKSGSSLAGTGDNLTVGMMVVYAVCGIALLVFALFRRARAGDGNA